METIDAAEVPVSGQVPGNGPDAVGPSLCPQVSADAALPFGAGIARGLMARFVLGASGQTRRNGQSESQV